MAGIIAAIIIGLIIAYIEKAMGKGSQTSERPAQQRAPLVRPVQPQRPPRRKPAPVVETPALASSPFLSGEQEGTRVTTIQTKPMERTPKAAFTKSQQELRRTIILGEILRRKF